MFCPNCGTQNESAATPCKKCGFKLSGVSAPKFKGTMVLNSDQTVQELIEEHRRRQAPGGAGEETRRASEPPPPSSGTAPPSSGVPGTRGPVLQPPRVAPGARRRMGGTMLGVAPQAGGVLPPDVRARPVPAAPPPKGPEPSSDDAARAEAPAASAPADPLAGTAAMPLVENVERLQPDAAASPASPAPAPVADAAPVGPLAEKTPAPARRAIADTAPIPQQPAASTASASARQPTPAQLRPLDIVLIIATFGLYGIVLWAKRRRPEA